MHMKIQCEFTRKYLNPVKMLLHSKAFLFEYPFLCNLNQSHFLSVAINFYPHKNYFILGKNVNIIHDNI